MRCLKCSSVMYARSALHKRFQALQLRSAAHAVACTIKARCATALRMGQPACFLGTSLPILAQRRSRAREPTTDAHAHALPVVSSSHLLTSTVQEHVVQHLVHGVCRDDELP